MEVLIVRKAEFSEIDILLEFEQDIIEAERPFDSTLKEGKIHYYDLERLVLSPDSAVFVAVTGDEIVGSGYARSRKAENYLKHEKFAYLGFMYVKPEHRGKGVNRRILEALEDWSAAQDITELRLEVYNDNSVAVKAYEKAGFKANLLEMRMEIPRKNLQRTAETLE
ncbi:MAG TPA: GNAT family N-acetyltransferase [Pyrinomonadaceae bacterium]|jgi:ribosomal protein S18 acetylase RimI-like enzyme